MVFRYCQEVDFAVTGNREPSFLSTLVMLNNSPLIAFHFSLIVSHMCVSFIIVLPKIAQKQTMSEIPTNLKNKTNAYVKSV